MNLTRNELENVYKNIQKPEAVNYIKTGLAELDLVLSYLDKGAMITIAGRPSMGKTRFCLSLQKDIMLYFW